jgi:hypothetical protein
MSEANVPTPKSRVKKACARENKPSHLISPVSVTQARFNYGI